MAYHQMLPVESILSVDGFYSVYNTTLSNHITSGELHDFYEVVYVTEGYYYVVLDGKRHTVSPGSCVFFSPNTYHSSDGSTPLSANIRIISFECKSECIKRFDNRVFALSNNEKDLFFKAFDAAHNCLAYSPSHVLCLKEGADAVDLQYAKLQFESFLLALYKKSVPLPKESGRNAARKEEFRRISNYLKENLHRPLTLTVISEECSLSISKLKAICRLFCDCGPIDYLISLRIIRAKYLILDGELNFSEIAERTGFATPHYFSRVFRDRTGMSPTEYAKSPNHNIF